MPNIKNNYTSKLSVCGTIIQPNAVVNIPDATFEIWKKNATAARWLDKDVISVVSNKKSTPDKNTPTDEPTNAEPTRAELFDKAKELGLNVPNNISTANLAQKVADATSTTENTGGDAA